MSTRSLAIVALLAAVAVTVLVARSSAGEQQVSAVFGSAANAIPGLDVRIAGRKVGHISDVEYEGGKARLDLAIDDEAWPLRRGTTAEIRFGGTIRYGDRYVELVPGPSSAAPIPHEGLLGTASTAETVEFDEVLNVYDRETRHHLRALIDNAGAAFGGRTRDVRRVLARGPATFRETRALFRELGSSPANLERLVVAGDAVAHQLAREDRAVEEFVSSAAATFDELAANPRDLARSIESLAPTLDRMTRSLSRADGTLVKLDSLARVVRPGARAMARMAPVADQTLATLEEIAPLARTTLATGTRAAPRIGALVREAGPFVGLLDKVARGLVPALRCIRPYGPEIAAFPATWAGFSKNYDSANHYARTLSTTPPYPFGTNMTPSDAAAIPGVTYAYPRPPGLDAGQPWFLPECGIGPEVLDPAQDSEARANAEGTGR